jgi:hypothetical protein
MEKMISQPVGVGGLSGWEEEVDEGQQEAIARCGKEGEESKNRQQARRCICNSSMQCMHTHTHTNKQVRADAKQMPGRDRMKPVQVNDEAPLL